MPFPTPPGGRIVVIGGGITGLSAAHRLRELSEERGIDASVVLLESASDPGGQIRTRSRRGVLFEEGPDTLVLGKPAGRSLCDRLGLRDDLVGIPRGRHAVQILHRDRLVDVPDGFLLMAPTRTWPVVRSPLFSVRGKLRLACERFIPPAPPDADESLASFVTRRFGREVLERVAEPVLAGLFTADARALSVRSTLPRFLEMEERHGSVTRALAIAGRRRRKQPAGGHTLTYADVASVRGGFGRIVAALLERLPPGCVRTGVRVTGLRRVFEEWEIETAESGALRADAVVIACPGHAAARFLAGTEPVLAEEIGRLSYASCATVHLTYRSADVGRPPRSYGFFVPRSEAGGLLAVSFVSVKFPDRAPPDRFVLRAVLGGALHPTILDGDDEFLGRLAHDAIRSLLRLRATPLHAHVARFPRAMPQFDVGFPHRLEALERRMARTPGLFLAGSSVGAMGIPDCVASGERAALAAADGVATRTPSLALRTV